MNLAKKMTERGEIKRRLRALRRRLSHMLPTRRRRSHDAYDDNPLPLKGAILAALSGLWSRRRHDDREPSKA